MIAFTQNADGTAALTIARGANGLWMQPGQQVTYTMRPNDDGSWAILRADWKNAGVSDLGDARPPEKRAAPAGCIAAGGQPDRHGKRRRADLAAGCRTVWRPGGRPAGAEPRGAAR